MEKETKKIRASILIAIIVIAIIVVGVAVVFMNREEKSGNDVQRQDGPTIMEPNEPKEPTIQEPLNSVQTSSVI